MAIFVGYGFPFPLSANPVILSLACILKIKTLQTDRELRILRKKVLPQ